MFLIISTLTYHKNLEICKKNLWILVHVRHFFHENPFVKVEIIFFNSKADEISPPKKTPILMASKCYKFWRTKIIIQLMNLVKVWEFFFCTYLLQTFMNQRWLKMQWLVFCQCLHIETSCFFSLHRQMHTYSRWLIC